MSSGISIVSPLLAVGDVSLLYPDASAVPVARGSWRIGRDTERRRGVPPGMRPPRARSLSVMARPVAPVQLELTQRFPVTAGDGFAYITAPANWPAYWPRLQRVVSVERWREPGDRAALVLRLLGRDVELHMTLDAVRARPARRVHEHPARAAGGAPPASVRAAR